MPKLKPLHLETLKLPESEITCKIGLSYGDICDIEHVMHQAMSVESEGKGDKNTERTSKSKIDGAMFTKEKEIMLVTGLKEWDAEDENNATLPIAIEHIRKLGRTDGDLLYKTINEMYRIESEKEMTRENKKK